MVELEFEPKPVEFLRWFSWHSAQLSPVSGSTTVFKTLLFFDLL